MGRREPAGEEKRYQPSGSSLNNTLLHTVVLFTLCIFLYLSVVVIALAHLSHIGAPVPTER